MKMSFKKLSMMVILGFATDYSLNAHPEAVESRGKSAAESAGQSKSQSHGVSTTSDITLKTRSSGQSKSQSNAVSIGQSNAVSTPSEITVVNLPNGQLIAAQVETGNSVQAPVSVKYAFDSNHDYYIITRNPSHDGIPGNDTIVPNTKQAGKNFKDKTTWNIATNTVS